MILGRGEAVMAIQITNLKSEDKGKTVSVWFSDGKLRGVLKDWSVKANLLIIWQEEAVRTCFASPEMTDFDGADEFTGV